jgi:hypothetical protein
MLDLKSAISKFGSDVKAKLSNPSATGEPEDQLRAPLERLFKDLAELCGFNRDWVEAVGESSLSTLKTRPDYAITMRNVLVGFVEVKAPGKGADPLGVKRECYPLFGDDDEDDVAQADGAASDTVADEGQSEDQPPPSPKAES